MAITYRQRVGRWTSVVRQLPLNLGYLVHLENVHGDIVGPRALSILGPRFAWWWAPTQEGAWIRACDARHDLLDGSW